MLISNRAEGVDQLAVSARVAIAQPKLLLLDYPKGIS